MHPTIRTCPAIPARNQPIQRRYGRREARVFRRPCGGTGPGRRPGCRIRRRGIRPGHMFRTRGDRRSGTPDSRTFLDNRPRTRWDPVGNRIKGNGVRPAAQDSRFRTRQDPSHSRFKGSGTRPAVRGIRFRTRPDRADNRIHGQCPRGRTDQHPADSIGMPGNLPRSRTGVHRDSRTRSGITV